MMRNRLKIGTPQIKMLRIIRIIVVSTNMQCFSYIFRIFPPGNFGISIIVFVKTAFLG